METKKDYYTLGESGFWKRFFSKLLFTLISVKVWGLIAATAVSTWLLIIHNTNAPYEVGGNVFERGINGGQWVTFNTTIWALIFGMKEIFKITEKRDKAEQEVLAKQVESNQVIATITSEAKAAAAKQTTFTSDGKEIVGEEPDNI